MDKVAGLFEKSPTEQVQATVSEFKGKYYFNVRVYVKNAEEEWVPTKKGLTLNVEFFDEFKKLVDGLEEEVKKLF